MHVNTQISRGLERWMAQDEAAKLEGLYGLAGLSCVETFSGLTGLLEESGFAGAGSHMRALRAEHADACARLRAALPIAVAAQQLDDAGGYDAALSGIFSKVGNALKKVAKTATKLSLSHQILKKVAPKAALLSPSQTLAMKLDAPKAKAALSADQKAAKAAAKQAKKDAKAAKKAAAAAAKAAAAQAAADAAGTSVLANASGVNIPDSLAQQLVASGGGGGGGIMPTDSMFDTPTDGAADDGTIFGLPPLVAGGLAAAGLGVLWLAFGRKKR
jgi:hypothetical protein